MLNRWLSVPLSTSSSLTRTDSLAQSSVSRLISRRVVRLAASLALLTASALCVWPVFAGTEGSIQTTVERLTNEVTYGDPSLTPPLVTYIGYKVTITNTGANTTNNIRFVGTIGSTVVTVANLPAFSSAEGARCDPLNVQSTQIACSFRQFKAGESITFAVFFKSPTSNAPVPNGVLDPLGLTCLVDGDCALFQGTTFYAEGSPTPSNSTNDWAALPTALGTANAVLVKSAVPKEGGTLFTGLGAAPAPGDNIDWLTVVQIPPGAAYTKATIEESFNPVACSSYLSKCNSTTLTIPGSFPSTNLTDPNQFKGLKIFLRLDASQRIKGTQIRSAVLYYSLPSHPDGRIDYTANGGLGFVIPACTNTDYGPLPQLGIPCIKKSTEYTRKNASSADYIGDWEFEIWALDNGRYSQ
jgi:hypothetical protein